jgi:hypothetical protein
MRENRFHRSRLYVSRFIHLLLVLEPQECPEHNMALVRRILRIAVIPLLLAALAYGAQALAGYALDALASYPGVPLDTPAPGRPTTPVTGRVVVVVVDGLREDTSRQLPTFQALRRQGADLTAWSGLPSLSWPGYTVLGTGAYPDLSGVASNWYEGAVHVDSLFARAQAAGLPTALATMQGWDDLYGPWVTYTYAAPWSDSGHDPEAMAWTTEAIGAEARRMLQETDTALLYVHFGETDEAGHAYGGDSPEYLAAALHADAQIAALADLLDWNRDTLILTADHGMSARQGNLIKIGGGHGGGEVVVRRVPLVVVGRGVTPGVYPEGGQADIVPTVATLLGLPIPAQSQGRTRLDILVLSPEQRAAAALALGAQQRALYDGYLRLLGARLEADGFAEARAAWEAGRYDIVEGWVGSSLQRLDEAVARAETNRLWSERLVRLPYLLVPLLLGVLAFFLYRPRRELVVPALLGVLFFALYWGAYLLLRGLTVSFTAVGGWPEEAFFLARTSDAAIAMGVVAVVAGLLWWRRPWHEVVWRANWTALTIAWAMVVQLGFFLWLYGLVMVWRLPDLGWGFKFYLDLMGTLGLGLAGILFPWLALGSSRLPALVRAIVARIARAAAHRARRSV